MMKPLLFIAALACASTTFAANKLYEPSADITDAFGLGLTGGANSVSANGRFASIGDDYYGIGALWCIDDPETFSVLPDRGIAYGVSNDGVVVGTFRLNYEDVTTQRPGVYKDGSWTALPLHDNVMLDGQRAEARCISPDGKYIGGHMSIKRTVEDPDAEATGGARFPCLWTLNESTGNYKLTAVYEDDRIENQGLWITCMNDDASILAGMLTCGAGSSTIPAIIKDGELQIWNELETRMLPFYYKGEIWGYSEGYFIDGHCDLTGYDFEGSFRQFDTKGRIYGYRTEVTDIIPDEDGYDRGTLTRWGIIYDPATDTFTRSANKSEIYTAGFCGDQGDVIFTTNGYYENGEKKSLTSDLGISSSRYMGCVYAVSDNGTTLAGATTGYNDVTGDTDEYPFVITLDQALSGQISVSSLAPHVAVVVSDGCISVTGAQKVTIHDSKGRLVSTKPNAQVTAGVYIVTADGASTKVLVK
ncbi:MAG: hypothetical protein LIP03_04175 [Bacteroidales bacterium]|nr:hypothetical protein [Bacteroidales bacterium]